MNKKAKSKNSDGAANSPNPDQDPLVSDFLDALLKPALQELESQLEFDVDDIEERAEKKLRNQKKNKAVSKAHTEIHISGRIDSFVFGALKETYFEEFTSSYLVLKDGGGNRDFLERMFSLFLENNPFTDKSNLEIFNDSIDLKKFKKNCPNFYAIYETVLANGYDDRDLVTKDDDVYLKTTVVRSTTYDHYSFLNEIMDSPNFSNPLRVFSTDNFIEIYTNQEKSSEGQLDEFLNLNEVGDEDMDDNYEFIYSDKQESSLEKFANNKYGFPMDLHPIAKTKQGSLQLDGFWPIDFFKFVLGDSSELYEGLYSVIHQHYQYQRDREIRVVFSNVSRCVFKIDTDLDYEKLMFLRCGLDEELRNYEINYGDDINLFNYISYDGLLLTPEETIFRDKGIEISPTLRDGDGDLQPAFCSLFID
jgi:hypothetical protein